MQVLSAFNRFLNGNPAQPPVMDNITIDDQELSVLDSLKRAITDACEKFARSEIASLYDDDGTRWMLTGIQITLQSATPQQMAEIKRKPARLLKRLAKNAIAASERYSKMFVIDDETFFGITIDAAAQEAEEGVWISVIGAYGRNDVMQYAFAFLGDLTDPAAQGKTKPTRSAGIGGTDLNEATDVAGVAGSGGTVLAGDALLQLHSKHFWPEGVLHPHGNTEFIAVQALPITLGRAPITAPNQAMPWGVNDQFVPIYGSVFVSQPHLRFDRNGEGQLCVTDLSKNGTWLNGQRLTKDEPVVLPAQGLLSLGGGPTAQRLRVEGFVIEFDQASMRVAANSTQAPADAVETSVAKEAPALWPFATALKEPHWKDEPRNTTANDTGSSPAQANMHSLPTQLGSVPTDLTGAARDPNAMALLRVRTANGHESSYPITNLPVDIGREALGNIPDTCSKVSRVHLRLEGLHGKSALQVINLAHNRNGTYAGTRREEARFVLPLAGAHERDGWLTLGEPRPSTASVQIRLEKLA